MNEPNGRWRAWLNEPVLHFIAAGLVLFVASKLPGSDGDAHVIVITPQREAQLASRYAMQFGAPPSTTMMSQLLDQEIEEEILFRHGVALGLDRDDEIVRRRVVQKVQFLLHDVQAPPEPNEAELSAYFQQHADRYVTQPRVTFSHVYFSADRGDDMARVRAGHALQRLIRSETAHGLGDPFPDLYHFAAYEPAQVYRLFGRGEFARAVFSEPTGRWLGPYRSGYGWHLIRVEARQGARQPMFVDVRERVRTDYLLDQQERRNIAAFSELASEYEVVRTDL
jgi:peptidyl-prolyl cis-trans isomerase C